MADVALSGQQAHRQSDTLWEELNEAKRQLAKAKDLLARYKELAEARQEGLDLKTRQLVCLRAAVRDFLADLDQFPGNAFLRERAAFTRLRNALDGAAAPG
jgi:hypothetical protein